MAVKTITIDMDAYMPGDEDAIKLDKRGKFEVRGAIHPRMKMTINVE